MSAETVTKITDHYSTGTEPPLAPCRCYPFRSFLEFCDWLAAARVVDEAAVNDPDGYDGGVTLHHLEVAYMKATCRDNSGNNTKSGDK